MADEPAAPAQPGQPQQGFFGRPAFLSVSGQLYAEMAASALSYVVKCTCLSCAVLAPACVQMELGSTDVFFCLSD